MEKAILTLRKTKKKKENVKEKIRSSRPWQFLSTTAK